MLFCGCSMQEHIITKNAKIETDSDYVNYINLKDNNELNSDGYFEEKTGNNEFNEENAPDGKIHVTFAKNSYISFKYYTEKDMSETSVINTDSCYLNPGTTIYAKINKIDNPNSNVYNFSKFIILKYDINSSSYEQIKESTLNDSIVFTIPSSPFVGEFSIVPLGKFDKRKINLSAFYIDKNGKKQKINDVKWTISDDSHDYSNGTVEIDPIKSYTVSCDYSMLANEYYFKESTPEYFKHDDKSHKIEFFQKTSVDYTSIFEVQLHQFISLKISNNGSAWDKLIKKVSRSEALLSIKINGNDEEIKDIKTNEFENIKEGDTIIVKVAEGYALVSKDIVLPKGTPLKDGTQYTITIPSTNLTEISITTKEKE